MRVAPPVVLSPDDRRILEARTRARRAPARSVERARILLLAADGWQNQDIATHLQLTPATVARWRRRFLAGGLPAIDRDAPRTGRPRTITPAQERAVVRTTTQTTPPQATHWSTRTLAAATGLSERSIRRIWRRHGLKPHLTRTFKISRDPAFAEKVEAIVGLYLNPPEHALVLCVDEKSQIQALDRTQPGLPLKRGRCGTMTHDYKRHGTATLFAALNTLDGSVISMCDDRHRHQEWLKFLRVIDDVTPPDKDLYLIVDNASTHKHAKVRRWLASHPRFHVYFTPTSSSWLNMVERFFRDLTQRRLRRGVFHDVEELIMAIGDYVDQHNEQPKPFIWTASAQDILAKVARARAAQDNR
jgi:transposase